MSEKPLRGYRFTTDAQWNTCLFVGADRLSREGRAGLRPFAPYASSPTRFETPGGWAPEITCAGEVLWRDDGRKLQRLAYNDDAPHAVTAPSAVAQAKRLIASSSALWAIGDAGGSLQNFDLDSLARQLVVEGANARIVDIAGDGRDGLFALFEGNSAWNIVRCDGAGRLQAAFALQGVSKASALVYLQRADRLVVLSGSKLLWFAPGDGAAKFSVGMAEVRPCFEVDALGSDGCACLFAAGTDGAPFGGLHRVLSLDSEGSLLAQVEIAERATGVTGGRTALLVTTARGLLRFQTTTSVPREASEIRAELVTPMLQSPASADVRRWLRVEATVKLPYGSTIEISYASSDDRETCHAAMRLAASASLPAIQRLRELRSRLGPWRTISFHGGETVPADACVPLSAPLFDVRAQYLWVGISLIASPGGEIPVLSQLAVLHPGRTLMENLPAMYQRAEAQPESFLRSLVGVLESTTQTLDARIVDMGRHVDPRTAPGPWLDFVARWLGLPWDDALSPEQKRGIATHAAIIAKGRGTRAGLEALLEALMPDKPRRFRIVDVTADIGLATVGGEACAGSRLPVVLGGLPSTATELGSKTILGRARLPCADSEGGSHLVGHIRIDVGANADEQAKWQSLLRGLIDEMVPATARVRLRWLSPAAFRHDALLDEGLQLEVAPIAHLGTDAITGIARLAGRGGISLSDSGADFDELPH